ncbi:MAG: hypothetical protein V1731_02570 [Candidatus Aenigmatarchaeota archaeon]
MTIESANVPALQLHLVDIARRTKGLEQQRSAIMREYVPNVKNRLMGYDSLFGTGYVRHVAHHVHQDYPDKEIRDLYFKDIRYRSKLRKIRDKISLLGEEYDTTLGQIKSMAGQKSVN